MLVKILLSPKAEEIVSCHIVLRRIEWVSYGIAGYTRSEMISICLDIISIGSSNYSAGVITIDYKRAV